MREKGLPIKKGVGSLDSWQEWKSVFWIHPLQTTDKSRVHCWFFSHLVKIGLCLFGERCWGEIPSMPWGLQATLVPWANCSVEVSRCLTSPIPSHANRPNLHVVWPSYRFDKPLIRTPLFFANLCSMGSEANCTLFWNTASRMHSEADLLTVMLVCLLSATLFVVMQI